MQPHSPVKRKFRWRGAAVFIAALTGFGVGVLALSLMNASVLYEDLDTCDGVTLPQVDAVVVLAGGRGRIAAAGDIWYRYWEDAQSPDKSKRVPVFYVSGMGPKSSWGTLESQVRRGVAPILQKETVILETESSDTIENADWLLRNAKKYAWKRILLMTSSYHMARSREIFSHAIQRERIPLQVETYSIFQDPYSKQEWMMDIQGIRVTLLEYFKWLAYRALH
jgi:uncharacterized SAM-binding protein YcdF (DUF218 family)